MVLLNSSFHEFDLYLQREPQQDQQQARRRRLAQPAAGVSAAVAAPGRNTCKAVSPVYLRPEQNIPEVFAAASTGFKPIASEAATQKHKVSSPSTDGAAKTAVGENSRKGNQGGMKLSRDDIVVTVRSAQV